MDRVAHPDYTITMQGRAAVGPGKVGNGVVLGGSGDYVSFGDQRRSCMGNLKLCKHGMTIAFLLNPRQFTSDSYILSSGSYSVFFRDNKVIFIMFHWYILFLNCCLFDTFQFCCFCFALYSLLTSLFLLFKNLFIAVEFCLLETML